MDYPERFITPALRLALPREEDAPALFRLVQREQAHLSRHLVWPPQVRRQEDTLATMRANLAAFAAGDSAVYLLWLDGQIAGVLSLNSIIGSVGEIGYWLAAGANGCGVMTQAVAGLINWYQAEGRLDRFILRCGVGNGPRNRLAQRLGFSFYHCQPQAEKIGTRWVDHNVYHWRAGATRRSLNRLRRCSGALKVRASA